MATFNRQSLRIAPDQQNKNEFEITSKPQKDLTFLFAENQKPPTPQLALGNNDNLSGSSAGKLNRRSSIKLPKTVPLNSNEGTSSLKIKTQDPDIPGLTSQQKQFVSKIKNKLDEIPPAGPESSKLNPSELGKIPFGKPSANSRLDLDLAKEGNDEPSISPAKNLAPSSKGLDSNSFQSYLESLTKALEKDPDAALKTLPDQILSSPTLSKSQKRQALEALKIRCNRFDSEQNPRLKKAQIGDTFSDNVWDAVGSVSQGALTGGEQTLRHFLGLDTSEIDKEAQDNLAIAAEFDKNSGGQVGKLIGEELLGLGSLSKLIKGAKKAIKTAGKIKHIERLGETKGLSVGQKAAIGSVTDALTTQEADTENLGTKKLTEVLENLPKKFTKKKAESEINTGSNNRVRKRMKKEKRREEIKKREKKRAERKKMEEKRRERRKNELSDQGNNSPTTQKKKLRKEQSSARKRN